MPSFYHDSCNRQNLLLASLKTINIALPIDRYLLLSNIFLSLFARYPTVSLKYFIYSYHSVPEIFIGKLFLFYIRHCWIRWIGGWTPSLELFQGVCKTLVLSNCQPVPDLLGAMVKISNPLSGVCRLWHPLTLFSWFYVFTRICIYNNRIFALHCSWTKCRPLNTYNKQQRPHVPV